MSAWNYYLVVLDKQTGKVVRLCRLASCCLAPCFTGFSACSSAFACLSEFCGDGLGVAKVINIYAGRYYCNGLKNRVKVAVRFL